MDDPFPAIKYNPSSIVQIFNNAINPEASKKILVVKGVYCVGRGNNYNGYYYDNLKDESSDGNITLIVPALIRNGLTDGQVIECEAYITKRVN